MTVEYPALLLLLFQQIAIHKIEFFLLKKLQTYIIHIQKFSYIKTLLIQTLVRGTN